MEKEVPVTSHKDVRGTSRGTHTTELSCLDTELRTQYSGTARIATVPRDDDEETS